MRRGSRLDALCIKQQATVILTAWYNSEEICFVRMEAEGNALSNTFAALIMSL